MKEKTKKSDLKSLIQLVTLGDLQSFSISYAASDSKFREALTRFLAEKYLEKDRGEELIAKLEHAFHHTKNVGNRWHPYDVSDWERITEDAEIVLKEASRLCDAGNATAALRVVCHFFELVDAEDLQMVDPYDEDLQYDISCLLNHGEELLLKSIAKDDVAQEEKVRAVNMLRKMVRSEIDNLFYLDMDELLEKVSDFCLTDEEKLRLIDKLIEENANNYGLETYVKQKIELLRKMGRKEETDATVKKYLYIQAIRKDEIKWALENKDYEAALRLVKEGREAAEKDKNPRLETEWMREELGIYCHMQDIEQQIALARQLFIREGGDMDDYELLKIIIPQAQWKDFLSQMLAETTFNVSYGTSIEADIYVKEKDGENLFRLLQTKKYHDIDYYDKYACYVSDEHAPTVLMEFVALTKEYAAQNMGAKYYERIRCVMETMTKMKGGKTAAKQLAKYFRDTYPRRSSFMAAIKKY